MSPWLTPELAGLLEQMTEAQVKALTLAGEARSEPIEGIVAVASVIRNRVTAGRFGDGYRGVCLRPWQFSCFSRQGGAGNFKFVLETARKFAQQQEIIDPKVKQCIGVAECVMRGYFEDNTRGATHYCVYTLTPAWAQGHKPAVRKGAHHFYNDIP